MYSSYCNIHVQYICIPVHKVIGEVIVLGTADVTLTSVVNVYLLKF